MQNLNVPKHLGIIPDGNRRWAKARGLPSWKGHEEGAKKFEEVLKWCEEIGIKMVTVYSLSLENLSRSEGEVKFLMMLFKRYFDSLLKNTEVHEKKVRVRVIGDKRQLPKYLQDSIDKLENATRNYSNYFLNFAMAYGGRAEILDATNKIAKLVKENKLGTGEIDEKLFSKNLYADLPDVDLIIRTSEQRISGFMPWQSTYAEIIFLPDVLFPALTKEDFVKAIEEFSNRERRLGK